MWGSPFPTLREATVSVMVLAVPRASPGTMTPMGGSADEAPYSAGLFALNGTASANAGSSCGD